MKYCDSNVLEHNWFCWLMAQHSPSLEPYRQCGLLWSKPIEYVGAAGRTFPNPLSAQWLHCVALGTPFYFASENGTIYQHPDHPIHPLGMIPDEELLTLESDHWIHGLDNPFWVQYVLIPQLISDGYTKEQSTDYSWNALLGDIEKTCNGISRKFHQTDDARAELVQETLMQIIRKLKSRKLVYIPGRAPVFNLLTTTIHRCMFSVLNKDNKKRRNTQKLASDLRAGVLPRSLRSLRVPDVSIKTR